MGTKHGKYSTDDLGRDGTGPLKVTEMEKSRAKAFSCDDGKSLADIIDTVSGENCGLAGKIKRR